ncbi:Major sperm protein [Dirofilaria immitis]|nr:Major sperm protein [Dirofilaria immitis]
MNTPPHMSNDRFMWTSDEPDVELIEPKILASVDKNWLTFTLQKDCPPQFHSFTLYNHGDHAFAFSISTSDNYAYFVSQVHGIVFGRQLHALPFVRTTNSITITIYRRPTNAFKVDEDYPYIKRTSFPRKDRLFIYLAPVFHWKTQPVSIFNHTMPYEKLRICLNYTAQNICEGLNFSLQERHNGWNTWQSLLQKLRR